MSALKTSLRAALDLTDDEEDHIDRLHARGPERLPARRTVTGQGARRCDAYVVASGWLAEHRTLRDGRRQILNIRLPGDVVGVDGLAFCRTLFATATLTECDLIPLPLEDLKELQIKAPRVGSVILLRTLRTEALLREWEVNLGRRGAPERLAHLLIELVRRIEFRGLAKAPEYDLPLTQGELSDCIGVTPEHLSRMMRSLREDGLAKLSNGTLTVMDEDGLTRRAGFEPRYVGLDGGRD